MTSIPWSIVVPIGILLSIAGIIGDLVESMLKRDAAIKDAGALLPGMGGVLDRLDSALLALPLMYYLLSGVHLPTRRTAMIERYTRPEMGALWTEDARYRYWLQVEVRRLRRVLSERVA